MAKNEEFYTDCSGDRWCDGGGLYQDIPEPCFICGYLTHRLDLSFETFFCNGQECNGKIAMDLKAAGGTERGCRVVE